jgi:phosphoribosylaminoimidazole-succinocarboxamide synthase
MVMWIEDRTSAREAGGRAVAELRDLGFDVGLTGRDGAAIRSHIIELVDPGTPTSGAMRICADGDAVEKLIACMPLDFESLPIVAEGDSKQVRSWTERVVVMRFKPTVYSFTTNRYGEAPGTDVVRLRFTSALFRRMREIPASNAAVPTSAFLAQVTSNGVPLLIERRVDPGNLEVRIKRYHVGSPVHRYKLTEGHASTQSCGPLRRWSRLDSPVVCFDWRHPLRDAEGNRLADEPLSDDYARVWMVDVDSAKAMARNTFLWMEAWFASSGVRLVDMCLFIDRSGRTIFGEISPDCMRVHLDLRDPEEAANADKDLWRSGRTPDLLLARYQELYQRLFSTT